MKKGICLCIVFCALVFSVFGQGIERTYSGEIISDRTAFPTYVRFKEGKYEFEVCEASSLIEYKIPETLIIDKYYYQESGSYKLETELKLPYVILQTDKSFQLFPKTGYLQYGRLLYLCQGDRVILDSLFYPKEPFDFPYAAPQKIEVSSFLTEKGIAYDASEFKYYSSKLKPWVEGKPDSGIGEYIEFEIGPDYFSYCSDIGIDGFLISNGFVNFDKPYLYEANNRVKEFHIISEENDIDFYVTLKDESNFQLVELPKELNRNETTKIRLVISDVYKGSKWNDTCVNRIIPVKSKYISNKNQ